MGGELPVTSRRRLGREVAKLGSQSKSTKHTLVSIGAGERQSTEEPDVNGARYGAVR